MDQPGINKRYTRIYSSLERTREAAVRKFEHLEYTGYSLMNKVSPDEFILDVGCGYNLFKEHLPNVVGIDPVHPAADHMVALQEFKTEQKFDVAFCLGSMHFGTRDDVLSQLDILMTFLKPAARIYFRFNVDPHHSKYGTKKFQWTFAESRRVAAEFGFTVNFQSLEFRKDFKKKLYAEWIRS